MAKYYTVCKHNSGAEPHLDSFDHLDDAVDVIHKWFLRYEFEMRDGKPYDAGNSTIENDSEGFRCFSNVEIHNGKVSCFTHCHGDGPVAYIKVKN